MELPDALDTQSDSGDTVKVHTSTSSPTPIEKSKDNKLKKAYSISNFIKGDARLNSRNFGGTYPNLFNISAITS